MDYNCEYTTDEVCELFQRCEHTLQDFSEVRLGQTWLSNNGWHFTITEIGNVVRSGGSATPGLQVNVKERTNEPGVRWTTVLWGIGRHRLFKEGPSICGACEQAFNSDSDYLCEGCRAE